MQISEFMLYHPGKILVDWEANVYKYQTIWRNAPLFLNYTQIENVLVKDNLKGY